MNPGPDYKFCPACGQTCHVTAPACACGHHFRPQFNAPNTYQYQQAPTMFAGQQMQPTTDWLTDLARRHRESNKLFIWTLVGGLICLWPIWIISYLEYNKMRDIRNQVASMGVDPVWWELAYRAR